MNRTPDNAPLRVLYLRSPGRLPFSAIWAGGLLRAPGIEFWQYPALPAEHRNRLDKLPNAAAAWESLQVRAIPDPRELAERIAAIDAEMRRALTRAAARETAASRTPSSAPPTASRLGHGQRSRPMVTTGTSSVGRRR